MDNVKFPVPAGWEQQEPISPTTNGGGASSSTAIDANVEYIIPGSTTISSANAQDGSVQNRRFSRQQLTWNLVSPKDQNLDPQLRNTQIIPATKNHTGTLVGNKLYIFGGYDGQKNHNMLFIFDVETYEWIQPQVEGTRPSGRNGHSATLISRNGSQQLLILGGWLGNGPLAAGDLHILQLSDHAALRWLQPNFKGEPPGPCNMHTADSVGGTVLVFRGGDGRAYLNDLHALDVAAGRWSPYQTSGEVPLPRANHASAVDNMKLYIFGGWDGTKRLNDLYILDTQTRVWTAVRTMGLPPQARAGMSLSYVNGLLYLFGGSGHTTRCFNDVHVFDPRENTWYEGSPLEIHNMEGEEKKDSKEPAKDEKTIDGAPHITSPSAAQGVSYGGSSGSQAVSTTTYSSRQRTLPERRAGHAAVTVGSRIFVFGGACGTQYYGKGKCFILSTDAAPSMTVDSSEILPNNSVRKILSEYFNNQQFSDVTFTFINDARVLYAHRILLTLFSDHFRKLFNSGMRECHEKTVMLPDDVSYDVFRALLEFMYIGQLRFEPAETDIVWFMDLLRAADQFCVDPVKRLCEEKVSKLVDSTNVSEICSEASRLQAWALVKYCQWLMRQENHITGDKESFFLNGERSI